MYYYTAIIFGLMGSFHCIGMCGPIALAVQSSGSRLRVIEMALIYNFGRTLTYTILGVLFGTLGAGLKMAGLQQYTSILVGIILILYAIGSFFSAKCLNISVLARPLAVLRRFMTTMLAFRKKSNTLLLGILNGLLPCGLVYMALATSITGGSFVTGAVFMLLFGLGTIPIMLTISLVGNTVGHKVQQKLLRLVPYVLLIFGVLFLLRGMGLGIPFISPPTGKLHL